MSDKFAGTYQTASPMTVTYQSWYLDSSDMDHVTTDSEALLQ